METASTYQQDTEMSIMLALARHVKLRTFIDVGAEKGGFARFLMPLGFRGSLFEPFPPHLQGLQALVEGTESRVYPWAVDEIDHEGRLHVAVDAEGRAMDYFHSLHRDEEHPHARHADAIAIQCRSLHSLAESGVIDAATGILKIDTEGNDLKVIQGMGRMTAEVLMCEFVTPALYSTWASSYPEALVRAGRDGGYAQCIAVKRFGSHELIAVNPAGFVDGQWGNLIFMSTELLALAWEELRPILTRSEEGLVTTLQRDHQAMEAKEQVIQELAQACKERLEVIDTLHARINQQASTEQALQEKVTRLKQDTGGWK